MKVSSNRLSSIEHILLRSYAFLSQTNIGDGGQEGDPRSYAVNS